MPTQQKNCKLKLQVERYQGFLKEKRTQLIEKNEVLISSQSANVKHIHELAQALKKKMNDRVTIEGQVKPIDWLQNQVAEKATENEAF